MTNDATALPSPRFSKCLLEPSITLPPNPQPTHATSPPPLTGTGQPGTQIKNRRGTLLGEKDFGLGVCGTWDFFAPAPCLKSKINLT
jgi:hypothetical protein